MKTKIIGMLLFILILASCAAQTTVQTQQTAKPAEQPAKATVAVQTSSAQKSIPQEIKDLFAKSATRAASASYWYRGPETGTDLYQFYVKGSKIRYLPSRALKNLDNPESYDSVFIDTVEKTARQYCVDPTCKYKGLKAELSYDGAYIKTPFDWLDVNTAEKIAEEQIERRATWVLSTDKGRMWVDTFYGIPLRVEAGGNAYEYQQMAVNSVQDSDVNP